MVNCAEVNESKSATCSVLIFSNDCNLHNTSSDSRSFPLQAVSMMLSSPQQKSMDKSSKVSAQSTLSFTNSLTEV
jgi:hypothetical protein